LMYKHQDWTCSICGAKPPENFVDICLLIGAY
jgi:hypothetical protein